jgi:hypothetical protein
MRRIGVGSQLGKIVCKIYLEKKNPSQKGLVVWIKV